MNVEEYVMVKLHNEKILRNERMTIKKTKYWTVGDLSKLTGLTFRTLRYYDQISLLSPSEYSESGHRLYDEEDILILFQILTLKDLGLSLEEIKSTLKDEDYTPKKVINLHIERLKIAIKNQEGLLKELQNLSSLMQLEQHITFDDLAQVLMMKKNATPTQRRSKALTFKEIT
ncbi:MerR family transcriptional regulator [Cytobacillus sp. OWB-43]|nr:MerR family transcriptional regulator [Cytobacillus sp. OWB-43]